MGLVTGVGGQLIATGSAAGTLSDGTADTTTDPQTFTGLVTLAAGAQLADGTAAAPALTFTADPDTGVYRLGNNQLAFATNGLLRGYWGAGGALHVSTTVSASGPGVVLGNASPVQGLYSGAYYNLGVVDASGVVQLGDAARPLALNGSSIAAAAVGPVAGQQHALPAVASDTVALVGATQTLTNKTLSSPTVTGVATLAVGAVGAPSLTFSGDADTGFYWIAADTLGLATGGTLRALVGPSGGWVVGNANVLGAAGYGLGNALSVYGRNAANSAWVALLSLDASNVVQLGASGNASQYNGGARVQRTATATSYTVLATDYLVAVTSTSAARTITLPTASSVGVMVVVVKDESGAAGTNNITVTPASGTIDGAASVAINTNYGSRGFYSNGTSWYAL